MLPFLQKKQQTGVLIKERQPDHPKSEENIIEECVRDILKACEAKDIKTLAMLFRELHDELHKEMEEGPKEEASYDSQNEQAAREE